MSLSIVEMFYSIQGEGPRLYPAIFIRLAGCNFKCKGFGVKQNSPKTGEELIGCDTIRATYCNHFKDTYKVYDSWLDIVNDIEKLAPKLSKHNIIKPDIIITGGEPTLHWNNPILQGILNYFISRDHKITIETNGSIPFEFTRKYQKEIIFSISVKLKISDEPQEKRFKPFHVANILENSPNSYVKFVSSKKTWNEDYEEMKYFLKSIPIWVPVILMPLGKNKEELFENYTFIVEKCVQYGFVFSPRVHIEAWNDKEGV